MSCALQMLMDPMGGIVMTNDGNAILREIQVQHPAAKSMIEISRAQDEEVGDGTTSVVILGKLSKTKTFVIYLHCAVGFWLLDACQSCIQYMYSLIFMLYFIFCKKYFEFKFFVLQLERC